jgi:gas vesicle protein
MLKKILIGVGILAVIGIGAFLFFANKIVGEVKQEMQAREPEFRQYITMSVDEQNAYVDKSWNDLMKVIIKRVGGQNISEEEYNATFSNETPELKTARIEYGRSVIAAIILSMDSITKDMPAGIKAKLQAEADDTENRSKKYDALQKQFSANQKK